MNERWVIQAMSGADRSWGARCFRGVTGLVEPIYRGVMAIRNAWYDATATRRASQQACKRGVKRGMGVVVSLGNLTTGGTGKTPMVMGLVGELLERGCRVGVLMRGYKAGATGSDEAKLYQERFGEKVPVVCDADRVRGKRMLVEGHGVDVVVLDDGFQHRRLARDWDIVLIDATQPFGFEHVLPRGLLREPISALKRADAVVLTRVDQVEEAALQAIEARVRSVNPEVAIGRVKQIWDGYTVCDVASGSDRFVPLSEASEMFGKVLLVTGIGRPEVFKTMALNNGLNIVDSLVYGDHHDFNMDDVELIRKHLVQAGCTHLLMTEKDWVKFKMRLDTLPGRSEAFESGVTIQVARPILRVVWVKGKQAFWGELDQLINRD